MTQAEKDQALKDRFCSRCIHEVDHTGTGWCYMFKESPPRFIGIDYCAQFQKRRPGRRSVNVKSES